MSSVPLIVLAEDNAPDVFLVRTALEEVGLDFQLQVFPDGEQVLKFLADVEKGETPGPDVLLLDLNMPRSGGHEVLERFRKTPRGASTSVIVITSSDSARDKELAASLGVDHFFRKPADLDEFMKLGTLVRQVLEPWSSPNRP